MDKRWVFTLYFLEALPFALLTGVSVILYKNLNIDNIRIAFFTSLITIPYFLKPLLAPLLESYMTKRGVILIMSFSIAFLLLILAFILNLPNFFYSSIGIFFLLGLASAINDIHIDGLYITQLSKKNKQAI
ncbi:MAG: hypothetical protein H0W64_11710 [Gammaproteobacteria bacterium]|nr:hypothetical protein [Gammaproteobacteria bacterium]